jgi:hypothetical protein
MGNWAAQITAIGKLKSVIFDSELDGLGTGGRTTFCLLAAARKN